MDLFIRAIGLARAETKIGMAILAYNMKRLIWLNSGKPRPPGSDEPASSSEALSQGDSQADTHQTVRQDEDLRLLITIKAGYSSAKVILALIR
jgi:hypothetical protein